MTKRARRITLFLSALALVHLALWPAGLKAGLPGYYIPEAAPTHTPAPRPYRVGLQIGHYKIKELPPELAPLSRDLGTYGGGRNEVDVAFDVANLVARLLRNEGVEVDLLPTTVPTGYSADAFVSLHADGARSKDRRGYKVGTRYRSKVAAQDAALAETLTEQYNAGTGMPIDYRVNPNMRDYYAFSPRRPNYRVSNFTPVAIIEMGYMTHPADREVLFDATGRVASGVATGIMKFLMSAYGSPRGQRPYGFGLIDGDIDPKAASFPTPVPEEEAREQAGDWQLLLIGKPAINVYREAGGGIVIATLPKGQLHRSTLRRGEYYRISLPDGKEGWVYVNAVIIKM